jgi:hypothetical protein
LKTESNRVILLLVSEMDSEKVVPADILEIFNFLMSMRSECSDLFGCLFKEYFDDLKEEIREWKKEDGSEPDWDYYRQCVNDLCRDDGMPVLFTGE